MPAPPRIPPTSGGARGDPSGLGNTAHGGGLDDQVPGLRRRESASSTLPSEQPAEKSGCFHLRHVHLPNLLEDGTLGLLLHGTTVVGFYTEEAQAFGWQTDDQIVQINGRNVGDFEDFLMHFAAAQEEGFPVDFGVLRRENVADETCRDVAAEKVLTSFFSEHSVADLAGQLERKFGNTPAPSRPDGHAAASASIWSATTGISEEEEEQCEDGQVFRSESITDNPYIQALRRQRDELFRSVEGWRSEMADSVASRLATQRSDGLATLTTPTSFAETPRTQFVQNVSSTLAWGSCLNTGVDQLPCGLRTSGEVCRFQEMTPTPRVDREMEAFRGPLDELQAWAGFASPQKECGSQNFATSLLPIATPSRAR